MPLCPFDTTKTLLRTLRGVMGIGLMWGTLWAVIFSAIATVIGIIDPDSIDSGEGWIGLGALGGAAGLVSGMAFGVLLSVTERGRPILDFSLSRAAMWGVLGAAALPLLTTMNDGNAFVTCPLGMVSATASIATARKARLHSSEPRKRPRDVVFGYVRMLVRDTVDPPDEP